MTSPILIQVAVLAWIVTILVTIASGPLIGKELSMERGIDSFNAHEKLRSLNVSTPSDFDGIKNTTQKMVLYDAVFLGLVGVLSVILTALAFKPKFYWNLYPAVLLIVSCIFTVLTSLLGNLYLELFDVQIDPYKTDFKSGMMSSFQANFRSDSLNISNDWNTLFIDYKCCGVNAVMGTSNDFDNTPWCTTSGSCQATFSQIPKSCCKGFTKYDYQNAPAHCHSSINPGQYYDMGCYSVIKKEIIEEQIRFNALTQDILTEGLKVTSSMGSCSFLSLVGMCVFIGICCKRKRNETGQNTSNRPTVSHQLVTEKGTTLQTYNESITSMYSQPLPSTSQTYTELTISAYEEPSFPSLQTRNEETTATAHSNGGTRDTTGF